MTHRNVKIVANEAGFGRVEVDGHDISRAVCSVQVGVVAAESSTTVVLKLAPVPVDFEGEAIVAVDDYVAEALVALGWTPPSAAGPGLDGAR